MTQEVYLLWFATQEEEKEDGGILIGIYESEVAAQAAIARLRTKPGFQENPPGFQIHKRQMGQDSWTDGFVRD